MRIVRQFERGVVFTLGKFSGIKGPGLRVIIPYIQTMQRVDVRTTPIDVPKQEVITKDNVTVGVDAIVYFRVLDPGKALLETTNYIYATTNFAQAALRDITGNFELDELLSKRDEISAQIKEIVDKETDKCPGEAGGFIDMGSVLRKGSDRSDAQNEQHGKNCRNCFFHTVISFQITDRN